MFFRGPVWAEAHLVGQTKVFLDGLEFYRSDHFGLLAYVDVDDVFARDLGGDEGRARARRSLLVQMNENATQKEQVEARALLQLGREEQAVALRRASLRDAQDEEVKLRAAAKQRRKRRARLEEEVSGEKSLFRVVLGAGQASDRPCAPSDVVIAGVAEKSSCEWASTRDVRVRGMANLGSTCYVSAVAQGPCANPRCGRVAGTPCETV